MELALLTLFLKKRGGVTISIILASASPRRKQLLSLIVTDFSVCTADVDELSFVADSPCALAEILAQKKCMAVAKKFPEDIVIGCDTVVDFNKTVLGKPKTPEQVVEMLHLLSGKTHLVHTGVYIFSKKCSAGFVATSRVCFAKIPSDKILEYAQTDEPYDKAGGYGIQGWAAKYVVGIEGCFFNIMGLPVQAVNACLEKLREI